MTGLPADLIARASTSYDAVRMFGHTLFWVEGRTDGRDVLIRWTPQHGEQAVTPGGFSVASYVHEYGGGAWVATPATVWFCNADDQRLYRTTSSGTIPVDPPPPQPGTVRYADLAMDPGGRHLWAVRERHEPDRVITDLVAIPATTATGPRTAASGWDFYAFPRPSPDGRRLAWTCWNAPLMPWDGTWLFAADISADGSLGEPVLVAGGPSESVFQPEWSPAGVLHFVSDRQGWWSLYKWQDADVVPVAVPEAELGVAQWEFGYSTYAFLDSGRIAVIAQRGSRQSLEVVEQGRLRPVDLPYTSIKPYLSARGSNVAMIASSPAQTPAVVLVDLDRHTAQQIAGADPLIDPKSLSAPDPFVFTSRDGAEIHGLFYPPQDPRCVPPPLVVKAHPGPTANVPMRLDWHTQYLTSQGFAVAEIDYRGSTGYGRDFRNALRGQWGERDAFDCADGAEYLAALGRADPQHTAIWGASAGGYTALRALICSSSFAACIARSPVIDPQTWRDAAPKFQAHQADALIGPLPEAAPTFRARSILHNTDASSRPVLLLHGDQDTITPVAESRALARALGDRCQLAIFPGEGHSLRSPHAQHRALETETGFLAAVLLDRRQRPGAKLKRSP